MIIVTNNYTEQAFRSLFQNCYNKAVRLAKAITHDEEWAIDIVQESFASMYEQRDIVD